MQKRWVRHGVWLLCAATLGVEAQAGVLSSFQKTIPVAVSGAVQTPGVVEVPFDAATPDVAIRHAGGVLPNAHPFATVVVRPVLGYVDDRCVPVASLHAATLVSGRAQWQAQVDALRAGTLRRIVIPAGTWGRLGEDRVPNLLGSSDQILVPEVSQQVFVTNETGAMQFFAHQPDQDAFGYLQQANVPSSRKQGYQLHLPDGRALALSRADARTDRRIMVPPGALLAPDVACLPGATP